MCPKARRESTTSDRIWLVERRKRSRSIDQSTMINIIINNNNNNNEADVEGSCESWNKVNSNELSTCWRAGGGTNTRHQCPSHHQLGWFSLRPMNGDQQQLGEEFNRTRRRQLNRSRMFSLCDLASIVTDGEQQQQQVQRPQRPRTRPSKRGRVGDGDGQLLCSTSVSNLSELARNDNELMFTPDNNQANTIRQPRQEAPTCRQARLSTQTMRSSDKQQSRNQPIGRGTQSVIEYSSIRTEIEHSLVESSQATPTSTMSIADDARDRPLSISNSSRTTRAKFCQGVSRRPQSNYWHPTPTATSLNGFINLAAATAPRRFSSSSSSLELKKLFLVFMMPTFALSLLVLASTIPRLARADPHQTDQGPTRLQNAANDNQQLHSDLLASMPPFVPTRRPSAMQLLYASQQHQQNQLNQQQNQQRQQPTATTTYTDHDRSIMMPNELSPVVARNQHNDPNSNINNNNNNKNSDNNNQPMTIVGSSSMNSPKFTRTNELEAFLDDMNHKELQTVASGRPIEDLFQAKSFDMTPVASHSNQQRPRHESNMADDQGRRMADSRNHKPTSGLMGSHSEQQIYSDCALILQRTYVKNMEDSKHQLVPFGKTEQACISYKHIDKAIEQAKHKLKFKEFVKMRKKPMGGSSPQAPPPPPLDVLHTSLEPPEDLVAAIGEINMAATQIIADQFDLSNDELLNGLPLIDMSKTKFASICPLLVRQDLKCELTRFRTFTAHCNNLKHPTWGAAKTPYARYLPPVHPDGIWVPRKSIVSEITFDLGVGHRETHTDFSPSMPLPAVHKEDESHGRQYFPSTSSGLLDETGASGPAASPSSGGAGSHHRLGLNSIEEPNVRELENQADAELMREVHDDGTHMDMASSVMFAQHAHPDNNNNNNNLVQPDQIRFPETGPPAPTPAALMHHHHQLATISEAAAQAHLHHMSPMQQPPPPPPPPPHMHNPSAMQSLPAPIVHRPHKSRSIPQELPSARLVSSIVHRDADIPNHEFSMLFLSWGQLLDHDMTRAATPPQSIKCCPSANGEPPAKHKLCLPIKVPPNDPFYSKFGVQCLEFRRTLAGVRPNCVLGPRVHQNANTAPIDANFVYGSSQATADSLRLFKGGRLRDRDWFRAEGLKPLLPAQEIDPDLNCLGRPKDLFCFLAGDVRVNEQTHLTVLHTLYMREHNRIADKLSELNPHWDDERTFQETRHLVAAGVQHVLINEYIPLLIGRKMTELYNLTVSTPSTAMAHHHHHHHRHHQTGGYWHGYDPSVTTSVSNSFAAAAFRQGHTFVQATIDRFNKFHEFVTSEKLRHLFMQPFLLYQPGVMDELVSGMINRQSQSYDPFMTEELAGHLFQPPEAEFGQDLASINLQRGRDQGLPGYNLFREWCGLPRAETFEQLEPYLTNRTAFLYSKLYKHVDDIDLWSAGISERKLPGAAIGPTFSCIISRQFSNTRRGDRFWYENPGLPSSFTPDQLAEIKKFSLAKLLCTNADDLPTIQRWAFRMAHPVLNPRVDCSQLPDIDLQYWQEE